MRMKFQYYMLGEIQIPLEDFALLEETLFHLRILSENMLKI